MGCGLACVAFVTGKSYQSIYRLAENKENAWTRGYYCPELVEILKATGANYTWFAVKKPLILDDVPAGSILFIGRNPKYPMGHFVVKVSKNRYMNPWKNFPLIRDVRSGFQTKIDKITHVIAPRS